VGTLPSSSCNNVCVYLIIINSNVAAPDALCLQVVTVDGLVFTWGRGVNGQLGHGNEEDMHEPTLLVSLTACKKGCIDDGGAGTVHVQPTA
jgi:alpha-tubulin suppressor-like RCC1 family protein